jgi:hypothetical protein
LTWCPGPNFASAPPANNPVSNNAATAVNASRRTLLEMQFKVSSSSVPASHSLLYV